MLVRDAGDEVVLEQRLCVGCDLHVALNEAGGAEGRVRCDGDAALLGELDEVLLREVRVVFDLEDGGRDLGVGEEVEEERPRVVADADALGQTLLLELLDRLPRALQAGLAVLDLGAGIVDEPAGRVAHRGVDVFYGHGEVDEVQVEVVNAPVGELLAGYGLDLLGVVERVPELGGDEEVFALDEALLDGARDALAALDFVAIVWRLSVAMFG